MTDTPAPASESLVVQSRFRTDELPATDRFDAWRDSLAPMFLPSLAPEVKPADIFVSTDFFLLGEVVLGSTAMRGVGGACNPGSTPHRQAPEIFVVEYVRQGGYCGYNGRQSVTAQAGDVVILEPARGLTLATEPDLGVTNLIVSREVLLGLLGTRTAAFPQVIRGDSLAGQILRQLMASTFQGLQQQPAADGKSTSGLLLGALAGLLRGSELRAPEPAVDYATVNAICAYIDHHLADPELGPEQLCRRFHCSRARLYRLFAPLGGVAHYIRQTRLERCHAALRTSQRKVNVSEVALEWGFSSISHFNRLFRNTYGVTPGEVRRAARPPDLPSRPRAGRVAVPEYKFWFERL